MEWDTLSHLVNHTAHLHPHYTLTVRHTRQYTPPFTLFTMKIVTIMHAEIANNLTM